MVFFISEPNSDVERNAWTKLVWVLYQPPTHAASLKSTLVDYINLHSTD